MQHRVLAGLLFACAALMPLSAQNQTPTELAQALQKKYTAIRDFSADFTHTYRGGVLKQAAHREAAGCSSRSRARCAGTTPRPRQKQFVSDGVKLYSYIPPTSR